MCCSESLLCSSKTCRTAWLLNISLFKNRAACISRRAEILLIQQHRIFGATAEVYFYLPWERKKINTATPAEGKKPTSPNSTERESSSGVQCQAFSKYLQFLPPTSCFYNCISSLEQTFPSKLPFPHKPSQAMLFGEDYNLLSHRLHPHCFWRIFSLDTAKTQLAFKL